MDAEWIAFIGNVGFPIAITAYVLMRLEGKLDKLTEAVTLLKEATQRLKNT
jgi:hypothetical protein